MVCDNYKVGLVEVFIWRKNNQKKKVGDPIDEKEIGNRKNRQFESSYVRRVD